MIGAFFHAVLYVPIYNLLIFFVDILPGGELGVAVVAVTLAIKIIIMPLSLTAVRTSRAMQALQPKLKKLQEEYKDDKERQAKETFALYKTYKVNPFASFLTVLIQFPILIALYWVVRANWSTVDTTLLYSFVHVPAQLSPLFLGFFLVTGPNIILALVAAATQFVQARYAIPVPPKTEGASMQEDFGRAMALQARVVLPIIIGVFSYSSGAIALYFITSNVLLLLQEYVARKIPHPTMSLVEEAKKEREQKS